MKIGDFIGRIRDLGLPVSDGYDIASWILGVPYKDAKSALNLPDDAAECALLRLSSAEPAAYITGRREFYGREFFVDKSVLIPRVETETLVSEVLHFSQNITGAKILDLCTGSGCILLSLLAERQDMMGLGVDISPAAIETAKKNAGLLKLIDRVSFVQADAAFFPQDSLDYDIITCNPPYLSEEEYKTADKSIKQEPKIALVSEDGGSFFYKKILSNISLLYKRKCTVFFEIGWTMKEDAEMIARAAGASVRFICDLAGINRVMVCEFLS